MKGELCPKKIKGPDYFDDCPICQAMKKSEERGKTLTMQELKESFKKAKEEGAVVGGDQS